MTPLRQPFGLPPPPQGEDLSFTRIVIAVDPPSGDGTCGIIACAKDAEGRAHILADHSVTARSPEGWARAVADVARIWSSPSLLGEGDRGDRGGGAGEAGRGGGGPAPSPANPTWVMCPRTNTYVLKTPLPFRDAQVSRAPRGPALSGGQGDLSMDGSRSDQGEGTLLPVLIVAEQNQGGLMVQSVIRIADPRLTVKLVTATQGKTDRASPVALLFEAGKVLLHGRFPELEAELCGMIAGGGYEGPGTSPDRADAMVWGLTELMLTPERAPPRVRTL